MTKAQSKKTSAKKTSAGTAQAEKPQPPSMIGSTKKLHDLLFDRFEEFRRSVPKHVNIERLFKVAVVAHSRNPELLQCTGESIILALMDCGQLNLEPNGILGEAYLIPRKNGPLSEKYGMRIVEAHFQPGYRGLVKLARNSGEIAYMDARPVYPGDTFDHERGSKPFLRHVEDLENLDRTDDSVTHGYSIAYFRDPTIPPSFAIMTKAEIEKRRARSAAPNSDMWANFYPEAVKKTTLRNHTKQLPASPELLAAVAIDEAVEIGQPLRLTEVNPDYTGQIPPAALPPVVKGTQKAHEALSNVPRAEVVEGDGEPPEAPQDAQEPTEEAEAPMADEKAKSNVWLTWCDCIRVAGVDDMVWAEKALIQYADEQGIEYGKMTQQQAEDLATFMAENPKDVGKWIDEAVANA